MHNYTKKHWWKVQGIFYNAMQQYPELEAIADEVLNRPYMIIVNDRKLWSITNLQGQMQNVINSSPNWKELREILKEMNQ